MALPSTATHSLLAMAVWKMCRFCLLNGTGNPAAAGGGGFPIQPLGSLPLGRFTRIPLYGIPRAGIAHSAPVQPAQGTISDATIAKNDVSQHRSAEGGVCPAMWGVGRERERPRPLPARKGCSGLFALCVSPRDLKCENILLDERGFIKLTGKLCSTEREGSFAQLCIVGGGGA